MTYKQLEMVREARLWIGHILIPAAGLVLAFPQTRQKIMNKVKDVKDSIRYKTYKGS